MAVYNGNKLVRYLHVGDKRVRGLYAGTEKVWPNVVRTDRGEEYGDWSYDDPVRRRTATPWEQDVYCDDSLGERRFGTPYTQEESAETSVDWDGTTYWNGSCGADYYYVDYRKVRDKYIYSDAVRHSDYRNGESRSRRIDGQCGWERAWRATGDWYRTGGTCNAIGVNGAYDCDGTYSVTYWNEAQDQSYCYPDMSGSTQTRTIWRVGPVAVREQVEGQCGYTAKKHVLIVEDGYEWNAPDDGGEWDYEYDYDYHADDGTLIINTSRDYVRGEMYFAEFSLNNILIDGQGTLPSDLSVFQENAQHPDGTDVSIYNNTAGVSITFDKNTWAEVYYSGTLVIRHNATGAEIRVNINLTF